MLAGLVYTPLLIAGYLAPLLFMLIGLRVIHRTSPDLGGQRYLNSWILCAVSALLLLATRTWAPSLLSIVLPNFLIFAASVFLYLAAAEILAVPARFLPWQVGLWLLALPPFLWFTYVDPGMLPRLFIHGVVVAGISSLTALLLFRHQEPALRAPLRACAWLFTSLAVLQAAWCATAVLRPPDPDFMHIDALEVSFSYLALLLGGANVASLMWLSICVHRRQLHHMAQTDSLTGLLNRRAFEEILRRELPRSGRPAHPLGLLLIDIDHFKRVNDAHGHQAGDEVLCRVSAVLRATIRISDVLARYGGEEFVVLLRDAALEESRVIAERIRHEIAALSRLPGDVSVTASIGVALGHPHELPAEILLRADQALYSAKRAGRNLVNIHRSASGEPAIAF